MNLEQMKKSTIRWGVTLVVGAGALAVFGFQQWGNGYSKDQVVMQILKEALQSSHFQPVDINDDLSDDVFVSFLDQVDVGKRFLTQADVAALGKFRTQLDDQFLAGDPAFFDMAYATMQKRFGEAKSYYQELLAAPFDFEIEESINTDLEKDDWAEDETELKDRWRKQLKLRILSRVYDDMEAATEEEPFDFATSEAKARERELEVHEEWFENLEDMERAEWFGVYMNAFTTQFDPHTEYYPPRQQENFEISMTGQLEGIGAQLRVRGDYVTVEKIVTGSASWRQGDLEEGDKITRVAQEGEEPVDVVGMGINKVVSMIRGPKGTVVILTVKKKDGTTMDISIERDIVELEATFARSAVLGDEHKIGYIRLPKFYVNFYDSENRNCAEDVRLEIEKLKEQDVEGIIFDLRNNGGGSLQAAIDIVGLFIDKGPVVQVKDRRRGAQTYSDRNGGTSYDGPLVVMVNEGSASASEIVAAAIQDYHRGVVVGSSHTHGKGTVQNVIEIDNVVGSQFNSVKPLGALKITTQKFYRINGHTTQLQGVEPDVILPFSWQDIDWGEKEYPTALSVDEISGAFYNIWPGYEPEKLRDAVLNSVARVDTSAKFARITAYATWLAAQQEDTEVNLQFDAYVSDTKAREESAKQWDKLTRLNDSMSVSALPSQIELFESDSSKAEDYSRWFKGLSRDLYLREAVHVMEDVR